MYFYLFYLQELIDEKLMGKDEYVRFEFLGCQDVCLNAQLVFRVL